MISPLLSAELRRFCETTSVRGVSRIIKSKSPGLFIIWLLGVLSCAGLLIWQLVVIFKRYTSFPVNTLLVQAPAWKNPVFPDISICNLCSLVHEKNMNFSYTDYLSKLEQNMVYDDMKKFFEAYNTSQNKYHIKNYERYILSPTAYFNNFPILTAYITEDSNLPILDHSYFKWDYTLNDNYNSMHLGRTWDPDYYNCYILNLDNPERHKIRGITMILYVDDYLDSLWMDYGLDLTNSRSTGMRVLVHSPLTIPNMKLGTSIAPGMETTITLTQTAIIRLSEPYSNCTRQETIGSPTDGDLVAYNVDYCSDVCLQKQYLKACGCISSQLQFTLKQIRDANYTVCGNLGITEANSSFNWGGFFQYVCADALSINKSVCQAECLTPCEEIKYTTSVTEAPWPHISAQTTFWWAYIRNNSRFGNKFNKFEDVISLGLENKSATHDLLKKLNSEGLIRDNFLQLTVKFDCQTYMEQRDVEAYSIDALGAQIGGVLSLWLGVSAILIFELCEFLFNLLVTCYRGNGEQGAYNLETFDSRL